MKKRARRRAGSSLLSRGIYRLLRWLVKLFYPKMTVEGLENLPEGGCVLVGNHSKMNGPICGELYFPGERRVWCASQMMELRQVPGYAFEDFWSDKPRRVRWLFKLQSYLIAPFSVAVFNNARTIPVYHDKRIVETMRLSVRTLAEGGSVVIFPECKRKHNAIVNEFQSGFVDVARYAHRELGRTVSFVPVYLTPQLRKIVLGKPIPFEPGAPLRAERERVAGALMDAVTDLAVSLPPHTVIPYDNIPKKQYPLNTDCEVSLEKAGR